MAFRALIGAWVVAVCVGSIFVVPAIAGGSHSAGGGGGQTQPTSSVKSSAVVGGALGAGKVSVPWSIYRPKR